MSVPLIDFHVPHIILLKSQREETDSHIWHPTVGVLMGYRPGRLSQILAPTHVDTRVRVQSKPKEGLKSQAPTHLDPSPPFSQLGCGAFYELYGLLVIVWTNYH